MNNSFKDFIFGDGNTMNHLFRQFSMGAVAIAVMQVANAQVSITNIVPMQIAGQGTEIEKHLYATEDGRQKRFFDKKDIETFWQTWHLIFYKEENMHRYELTKVLWRCLAQKAL